MSRENLSSIKALKVTVLAALFGATSAMAAAPNTGDKVGALITVKTGASFPGVASDASGDSVVVWDVAGKNIVAQRYDADGKPVGARFTVNTSTAGARHKPRVAMDAAGDFVVVWTADGGTPTSNVFAQLFDKTDAKVGTEFQVNVTLGTAVSSATEQFPVSVAMDAVGDFVVTWTGTDAGDGTTPDAGIFAQRFDATGAALTGADIAVNPTTTGRQVSPTIAMAPNGNYVIAWTGVDAGDSITPDEGIFAQLYDNTGTVTKAEFAVNTDTTGAETLPSAGMDLTGNFVIAFSSKAVTANDTDVHAQRFDATGAAVAGEFLVNSSPIGNQVDGTAGVQSDASVAMDVNGEFVIGWDSQLDDTGALGDYANFYNAAGTLEGGTKLEGLADTGFAPAVAMDAGGDTFASATITTNAVSGLFAQRFAGFNSLDLSATLSTTALTTVKPGDAIALTASITNNAVAGTPTGIPAIDGALSTATTVQAALTLPSGTALSSSSGTGWTCPNTATANVLTCTFAGGLAAGVVTSDLTVNLQASDTGGVNSFTHDASGLQPDPSAANNEASVGVTVDHPPVADDGSLAVALDTATPGNAVATDADGDPLTYSVVSTTTNGTLTFNPDGSFSYTPNSGFSGHDTFTFKANDGTFDSNDATFTLRVDNQAPVATDGILNIDEDTVGTGTVAATDADGDTLTFSKVSDPANGSVTVNADGSYSYTPNANFNGTDSFSFKANDGLADSGAGTVTITINPVNDAPVANDGTLTTAEDTLGTGTVTATDVDGDTLTFSKATSPSNGSATVNADGSFSYTPAANFHGSDSFIFSVSDGNGGTATGTVSITVTSVNDAPVASDGALSVNQDSTNNPGTLSATDVDGDALTFSKVSDPANGTVTVNANGSFSYTPNAGFTGADSFSFKANDGTVDSNTATVSITVNHVNHAPVANDSTLTTAEDTLGTGTVTATDADGDALTFSKATSPANGSATVNANGSFSYTPNANFNGADSFTFSVSDGNGGTATGTVSVTVTSVNDAPVAAAGTLTVNQDTANNGGNLAATDVDGDALTFSKVSDPANGTVTVNANGSFSYTPNAGFTGADSFSFKANDGTVDSNTATVNITVSHVNHAPTATAGTLAVNRNTAKAGLVSASDTDGDNLSFSVVSQGAHGTVSMQVNGSFTYTPARGFFGSDSFTFKANDGIVDSAAATITVTVTEHAPVALPQIISMTHNTVHKGTFKVADRDTGDKHTFSRVTSPKHGTLVININTGAFSYTPAKNFTGKDAFTFKVSDGAKSDTSTISITVK
jgi:VCBS repeat-containing protein